jgi:ribose transport system ATP-binding protein
VTGAGVIALDNISMTFPGQRALDRVSLEIRPGEVHALLGENGSGKSTLIKILAGLYVPDPGSTITLDGIVHRRLTPIEAKSLGFRFVHQDLGLVREMNACENFGLTAGFARRRGLIRWREQARLVDECIRAACVPVDVMRPIGSLPPIEQTGVAVARAVYGSGEQARLLVFDEPTAALLPHEVDTLMQIIRSLARRHVGILYVSHRLAEVVSLADRISVLRDGRLVASVRAEEGLDKHALARLIAGETYAEVSVEERQDQLNDHGQVMRVEGLRTARLAGVTFSLRAGEILGFAGLAGSGREDVADALVGAGEAAEGTLRLRDHELDIGRMASTAAMNAGVSIMPSNRDPAGAVSEFTIRENILLAQISRRSAMHGRSRREKRRFADQWLDRVDVRPNQPTKPFVELSGGNQQKVLVARALETQPAVLLLDDATAGVDIAARQVIYQLIIDYAASGGAVVVCSADVEDLVSLCTRVIVLVDGIVHATLPRDLVTEPSILAMAGGAPVPA